LHWWVDGFLVGGAGDILRTIVFGLPVLTYAVPIFMGLHMLTHESNLSRTADNIIGPSIIIVGWGLATTLVYFWVLLITWVWRGLFG
jgi:hypothetical protein